MQQELEHDAVAPGGRQLPQLPGGLVALYDGRGRNETPVWIPSRRAVVFADALTAPDGELRVWLREERTWVPGPDGVRGRWSTRSWSG